MNPAVTEAVKAEEPDCLPLVSVVVPTYRRPQLCARLLHALCAQTLSFGDFEVLAVDDCSGDETGEMLQDLVPTMPYRLLPLRSPKSGSPGRARNVGWRAARAPVLAFIDDDCVPEPDWLAAGLNTMSADPALGVLQGYTKPPDDYEESNFRRWHHRMEIYSPTPYFEACNIFYRREALERVNGFDEEIGFWGDDTHGGWSVKRAGWTSGFAPDAVVVHDVTNRPVKWHLGHGLDETNVIRLAVEFPEYREVAFWRPWAVRRSDAAFVAAMLSAIIALRWRPAILGALPYLWWQRPSIRNPDFVPRCFEGLAIDASRSIGQIRGALRYRIFVV
jgi:glycosyltransferase involved in cell wall biosynthesis